MNPEQFDIVVAGAGPAGSMAAYGAAKTGSKVLLLERDANIGLPVRCGEGISTTCLERYFKIDPKWVARELQGMYMYAPDGSKVFVDIGDEFGVILERAIFDRFLAEQAAAHGAEVRTKCDVTGLKINDGRIEGVYFKRLGQQYLVDSKVVIGADGVESRVGRWAGIKSQLPQRDTESAYQKVLSNLDFNPDFAHFYFGNDLAPGGYIWVFPKGDKTANVGIGVKANLCDPGTAYQKLNDFIRKQFGNPAVVGEMAGTVPCARPIEKPFTDGLVLVGDAAHHCNPLTGGGIYSGMVSGYESGIVAAEAVQVGDCSAKYLKKVNKVLENRIIKSHKRVYRLAQAVSKLSDESMNKTAHDVLKIPDNKRTLNRIFIRGLSSFPSLMVDIMKTFVS